MVLKREAIEPILTGVWKGIAQLVNMFNDAFNNGGGEDFDLLMREILTETGDFKINSAIGMSSAIICAQFKVNPVDFNAYSNLFINRISNSFQEKQLIITLMTNTYSRLDKLNE